METLAWMLLLWFACVGAGCLVLLVALVRAKLPRGRSGRDAALANLVMTVVFSGWALSEVGSASDWVVFPAISLALAAALGLPQLRPKR